MKKSILTSFTLLIFLISCKKSETLSNEINDGENQTVAQVNNTRLENKLLESTDLANFYSATKAMIGLVDVGSQTNEDIQIAIKIAQKPNFAINDLDKMLDLLKINKVKYKELLTLQSNSIKGFQKENVLSNQVTNDVWNKVLKGESNNIMGINTNSNNQAFAESGPCHVGSWAVFAIESAGCIALGTIPFGQFLVIPCTSAAIAHLTASLMQCAQQ